MAGPEIAVATTKAFSTQLIASYLFAIELASAKKQINKDEYHNLLNRAYNAMYDNTKFRAALEASKGATLTHSIGKNKKNETVLTTQEFCSRLTYLRDKGKLPVNEQLNLF